ncbi:MAG: AraC family transcriptional regulator [Sphingobacteriaceae bacterium]|nr:MAG: AraC family transcriptional regulator [Sphingobacteriaceae bacterium]
MSFQLNIYSVLLLLPFTQGILFGTLLMTRKQEKYIKANRLLGMILLLMSIKIAFWMLGFAGWYDTHDAFTSLMFYFPFNTVCLMGPLLYFYFLAITNQDFRFERRHLRHLWLPATWFFLIIGKFSLDFLIYYPFPDTAAFQFGTKGPWAELDKTVPVILISYGSFSYYLWLTLKAYRTYRQYTQQNFSLQENVDFIWLRNLLLAIGTGLLIMFAYQLINWVYPLSYKADWYSYLFLGTLVYYVSIKGYQVQMEPKPALHFIPATVQDASSIAVKSAPLPDLELRLEHLTQLLIQEKHYLIPDLTLAQLAKMAKVNTGILSRIINTGFSLNFNDFINSYRVREVITRFELKQHQRITLLSIALECGFNSKATFNRAFKKHTGKTPVEYLAGLETEQNIGIKQPVISG